MRRRTDLIDPWLSTGGDRGGGRLGTMLIATVLGVGVGLLAAPQPGARTRSALRKRLAAVGEDIGDELEHLEERSRPLRHAVRDRAPRSCARRGRKKYEEALEEVEDYEDEVEEEDEGSRCVGHRADGRRRSWPRRISSPVIGPRPRASACARPPPPSATRPRPGGSNFQRRRGNGHPTTESGARIDPADSAPQTS